MKTNRRSFIKTLTAGLAATYADLILPREAFSDTGKYTKGIKISEGYFVLDSETQLIMEHFAEALLPGSKKLGLKNALLNYYAKNKGIAAFIDSGLWNIDGLARNRYKTPFYKLKNEQVTEVINHINKFNKNRNFFAKFMRKLTELYYSHPDVWKKLNYYGPPQPRGFMDYSKAPKIKSG